MLHDDGASTDNTGTLLVSIAMIGSLKGSRTSPEKLKPKEVSFGRAIGAVMQYRRWHLLHGL